MPDLDPVEIITDEWERALQHDDYPRCLALSPHLLGEYGYGVPRRNAVSAYFVAGIAVDASRPAEDRVSGS